MHTPGGISHNFARQRSRQLMLLVLLHCGTLISAVDAAPYTILEFGTFGGEESSAVGINSAGHVVGAADLPNGTSHAFLYQGGELIDLGTLGGAYSNASDINDAGQISGTAWNASNQNRAFRYEAGTMHDLGTLASGPGNHRSPSSIGSAINAAGHVVGNSHINDVTYDGFVHDGATMQRLLGPNGTVAYAINNLGQIVGSTNSRAFLYDGTFHELGDFGGTRSYAEGITKRDTSWAMPTTAATSTTVRLSTSTPQCIRWARWAGAAVPPWISTTTGRSWAEASSRSIAK